MTQISTFARIILNHSYLTMQRQIFKVFVNTNYNLAIILPFPGKTWESLSVSAVGCQMFESNLSVSTHAAD